MKEYLGVITLRATDEISKCLKTLEGLESKLKVQHGYPGNKNLLEALNTDVLTTVENLKENVASVISKNKDEIQRMNGLALMEMQTVFTSSNNMLMDLLNPDILSDLQNQLVAYHVAEEAAITQCEDTVKSLTEVSSKLKMKEKNSKTTNSEHEDETDINMHLKRKPVPNLYRLSLDSVKLNAEVGSSKMKIPELHEAYKVISEKTKVSQIRKSEESSSSSANSLNPTQSEVSISFNIEEYLQIFKAAADNLDAQKSLYEEKSEKWLKIWKCNVEKVQQLYNVKLSKCQVRSPV
ncbi:hypothetical protein L9F63_021772 [Diploptera punctata]|uniref:Uncharacterized protein n=1 Tax=Diploptera punctata TaxID=6984 RepID=A0AAD7ZND6_DIPPU|nr:hypothetical protein L9F63_021772 [Diploptera punctata]